MTAVDADPTAQSGLTGSPPTADSRQDGTPLRTGRGHTIITPRVAEKIARRSAEQTAGVCGVVRGGLSRLVPWVRGSSPAAAEVESGKDDDSVAVDLTIKVCYPEPVGEVTRRVREQVVERLTACTGLRVTSVDILVESLVADRPLVRRVR